MTAQLAATGLRKTYGSTVALDDVGLEVQAGEVHALLGANGSGKSTLVKILAGVVPADAGTVAVAGRAVSARHITSGDARDLGLRFVHQDPAVFAHLSVAENLALGHGYATRDGGRVDWKAQHARARDLIERFDLGCHPKTTVAELSPAKRTMVAIARALQHDLARESEGGVLVLDEPTASLSARESGLLLGWVRRLAGRGTAVVYITHRLHEIDEIADRVTVLRDGRRVFTAQHDPSQRDRLIEHIAGRALDDVYPARRAEARTPLLRVEGLAARGLRDINFTLGHGEVLGIAGFVGSGRSTLLKSLFGIVPRKGMASLDGATLPPGSIRTAIRAGVAYVPEDRLGYSAFVDLSLQDNISAGITARFWRGFWMDARRERAETRHLIKLHAIKAHSEHQALSSLSGGNQQKAILARWLRRQPRLMLLDEPTQGVDAGARREIYRSIRGATEGGSAAIVVSSDFEELANVCDRVLVLRDGTIRHEVTAKELSSARLIQLSLATTNESGTR
ncbi:sugar ABC transporter ATP-binding protein [Georgenia sp. AZ-5]|uniref:sugar ABC transporter ATP-binding protein n=1 Tax=Georgenia sp. AZ-5 TaxID=3367526 RepID=UPI003754533C